MCVKFRLLLEMQYCKLCMNPVLKKCSEGPKKNDFTEIREEKYTICLLQKLRGPCTQV